MNMKTANIILDFNNTERVAVMSHVCCALVARFDAGRAWKVIQNILYSTCLMHLLYSLIHQAVCPCPCQRLCLGLCRFMFLTEEIAHCSLASAVSFALCQAPRHRACIIGTPIGSVTALLWWSSILRFPRLRLLAQQPLVVNSINADSTQKCASSVPFVMGDCVDQ